MFRNNKSFASSVAGASIILALISVLSKGFGFFREILYANTFGLSTQFDLFLVSAAIPFTINTAVIYIGQHYFIPTYHKLKKESDLKAINFLNTSFYLFILGGILLITILGIFSETIMEVFVTNQSADIKHLSMNLFLLFLITIPLNAGVSILSSYMQSEYRFTLPAVAQLLVNLTIIIMIIIFNNSINIYVLPVSFILGNFIAFIVLIISLSKDLKFFTFEHFKTIKINQSKVLSTLIIIEFISLSYPIVDRYFYDVIPSGGIAALNYALTVYSMPVSIFTMALITAIFPKFAEQANENRDELVLALKKGININIFIIAPITAILVFKGYDLIKMFYERGQFNSVDTRMTEMVLIYYSISLIFYSTYLLSIKVLYSLSMHLWVLILSLTGFIIKIILNLLIVNTFYQNGLALSTSLVFIILFLSGFYISSKKLKINLNILCFKSIIYSLVNVITAYSITQLLIKLFGTTGLFEFVSEIIIFSIIYIINSYLISSEDLKMATEIFKNYLPFSWREVQD